MTTTHTALAILIASLALPASAQTIYRCVDAAGGTLISNSRVDKNCKVISSGPEVAVPNSGGKPRALGGAAATPTPAGFPKVQEDTQKARDNDRRHILTQEMAGEQRNLELAKKELAEQEAMRPAVGAERLSSYRDRVAQHERNIQALQKELGKLR